MKSKISEKKSTILEKCENVSEIISFLSIRCDEILEVVIKDDNVWLMIPKSLSESVINYILTHFYGVTLVQSKEIDVNKDYSDYFILEIESNKKKRLTDIPAEYCILHMGNYFRKD